MIRAQIRILNQEKENWTNKTRYGLLKDVYVSNWEKLFTIGDLGNLDAPLTHKVLSDPDHKVTKHILYLYSMESFIYAELNRACRDKNKCEIECYGAFAASLSYILYHANGKRKDKIKGNTYLYRGLKMLDH